MGRVQRLAAPPQRARPKLLSLLERYLAARGVAVAPQLAPDSQQRAVWLVGSVLQVEPALRQRLLESGDPELAEAMLAEELARLGSIGRLGAMHPRPPSPN